MNPTPPPRISNAAVVVTTIRPSPAWRGPDLRELWRHKELILVFGARDIKLRYRQTALGVSWVLVHPLLGAVLFAVIFGRIAGLAHQSVPYVLLAFTGLVAWIAFSSTLTRSTTSLVQHSALLTKVYFPRLTLPLSTALPAALDAAVGLAVALVLIAYYHIPLTWRLSLVPVLIAALILLALGLGFIMAALAVRYRDVQHITPVLLQLLLYANPVGYSLAALPQDLQNWMLLNPAAVWLESIRWSMLHTTPPPVWSVAWASVATLVLAWAGVVFFRQLERQFADVI